MLPLSRCGFSRISSFVWAIEHSHGLSIKEAPREISLQFNICPVISQNRFLGDLFFTAVPYKPPASFDLVESSKVVHSKEEVIQLIAQTTLPSDDPLSSASQSKIEKYKETIPYISNLQSGTLVELLDDETFKPGLALDLGCGGGTNAFPLLENGWRVDAVDTHAGVLAQFHSQIIPETAPRINLFQGDMASIRLKDNYYDLVVAMDSLPYLLPSTLLATLEKIHRTLVPGGLFIGSLFFEDSKLPSPYGIRFHRQCGAHYLKGDFVKSCLTHTGFEVVSSILKMHDPEGKNLPTCVEFMTKKPT